MMHKLIVIFNCLILVSSNPLQGLQSCPVTNYQLNYANSDPLARGSSFDAYPQQLYYTNQWLSPQNNPYLEQSNIYYDNSPISFIPNSLIDANLPMYSQNGFNAMQYQPNLIERSPQLMNNYVIVPEKYLNDQRFDNRQNHYLTSVVNGYTNENIWMPKNSNPTMNYYDPVQQPIANIGNNGNRNIISTQKSNTDVPKQLREGKENESIKRKSSKKNHKRKKNTTELCRNDENHGQKSKTQTKSKSNKVIDSNLRTSQINKSDQKLKANKDAKNTKPKTRSRSKSNKMVDENMKAKDVTVKDCILKQDINECLDINDDCTNLENRRPRNNHKTNPTQTFQQQYQNMPQDFTNNIASYLNNFMPNQNFNANLFNGNGNFPYNFDYLYQVPQQPNTNTNENDKRRNNRRKKKKSKSNRQSNSSQSTKKDICNKEVELSTISAEIDTMTESIPNQTKNNECEQKLIIENNKILKSNIESNYHQSSNKKQNIEDNCMKMVDLSPKSLEIETIIEPISNVNSNYKYQKQVIEVETPEKNLDVITEPDTKIPLEPSSTFLQKNDSSSVVLDEQDTPNIYDNDIYDDYYPDFTSDNIYLSKEDHDWNFHDRHYYTSDNNAEMSTERRQYVPNTRQSLHEHHSSPHQYDTTETVPNQNYDNIRDVKALAEEISFKTPPGLEFPDFKTEMINKNQYSPGADTNFQSNFDNNHQSEKVSSFSNVKSVENKNTHILDNTVETVYAHSKVVKYGGSEPRAKVSRKSSNTTNNNVNEDKPTIILAKPLNTSENYQ